MGNIGAGEILVIGILALIVLGPDKLPEAARKVGQVISELRKVSSGFQAELRDALHEPVDVTSTRSPTPKATPAPVPDPDAGVPDGSAIDPGDVAPGSVGPAPDGTSGDEPDDGRPGSNGSVSGDGPVG